MHPALIDSLVTGTIVVLAATWIGWRTWHAVRGVLRTRVAGSDNTGCGSCDSCGACPGK